MTEPDPVLLRIEAFDRQNGGGVSVCESRGGYTLTLTATRAPIARLKPEGQGDTGCVFTTGPGKTGGKMSATWAASCSRSTNHSTRSPIPTSSGPGPEDKIFLKCTQSSCGIPTGSRPEMCWSSPCSSARAQRGDRVSARLSHRAHPGGPSADDGSGRASRWAASSFQRGAAVCARTPGNRRLHLGTCPEVPSQQADRHARTGWGSFP